ncbi:MAG: hypothetical protein ACTSWD_02470 [Candidatus Heimdallarchaeota archaeon]
MSKEKVYNIVLKYYDFEKRFVAGFKNDVLYFQMDLNDNAKLTVIIPITPDNIINCGGCSLSVGKSLDVKTLKFKLVKQEADTLYYELDR